jgi:hypothetical protein
MLPSAVPPDSAGVFAAVFVGDLYLKLLWPPSALFPKVAQNLVFHKSAPWGVFLWAEMSTATPYGLRSSG